MIKTKFCTFCFKVGKLPEDDCYGHRAGDPDCPILMETTCSLCGRKGHTRKYCQAPFCTFCWKNGKEESECVGHTVEDNCPTLGDSICRRCNKKGHTAKFCHVAICNFCKEIGHKIDKCPEKQKLFCTFCGENGHTKSHCKSPYARDNRNMYH